MPTLRPENLFPLGDIPYSEREYAICGATIADGELVSLTGLTNGRQSAVLADATLAPPTVGPIWVAHGGGASGIELTILPWRIVRGTSTSNVDTSGLTAGQLIYLAASGGWSAVPTSFRSIPVGIVLYVHATEGVIKLCPQAFAAHGESGVYEYVTTITTAQVLALNATPQTVVPAPGAGYYTEFVSQHLWLDYNAAAYAGVAAGEDLVNKYTDGSGDEVSGHIETTGFVDQTNDEHRTIGPVAASGAVADVIPVANAAIVLHLLVAEIITGDSPIKVSTLFRVRTLEFAVA